MHKLVCMEIKQSQNNKTVLHSVSLNTRTKVKLNFCTADDLAFFARLMLQHCKLRFT